MDNEILKKNHSRINYGCFCIGRTKKILQAFSLAASFNS